MGTGRANDARPVRSTTNIPSACRIANIAINDAMILPYDANPARMEFSERTGRAIPTATRAIAFRSPWQNAYVERLIGSIRRECLDHMIVFGEAHLRRILGAYAAYYNESRIHRSLNKDAPSRLRASVPSRHTRFSMAFTINIAESNFRYTQGIVAAFT